MGSGAPKDRRPVVISGPSGVGKGTLIDKLCAAHPGTFTKTVSHTTRKPRANEVEGSHYYFVTQSDFQSLIQQNAMVEHTQFSGNYYGTSKRTILEQTDKGLVVLLDIELDGVKAVKADPSIGARFVFIKPPSSEELEKRLRGRSTDSEEAIQKRLQRAKHELEAADMPGFHDRIIINDNLDKAYEELETFIYSQPS